MHRSLRALVAVWGAALVVIGISHLAFGADSVLGRGTFNATLDSEIRFAGALLVGYGLANVWAVRRSPVQRELLLILAALTAVGAAARVLSMVSVGMPNWFYTLGTVIEVVVAILTLGLVTSTGS